MGLVRFLSFGLDTVNLVFKSKSVIRNTKRVYGQTQVFQREFTSRAKNDGLKAAFREQVHKPLSEQTIPILLRRAQSFIGLYLNERDHRQNEFRHLVRNRPNGSGGMGRKMSGTIVGRKAMSGHQPNNERAVWVEKEGKLRVEGRPEKRSLGERVRGIFLR